MKVGYQNTALDRPSDPGTRWFRLASLDIDSVGTIILPDGIHMERYTANPVFCWQHPLDPERKSTPTPHDVIGKCLVFEQGPDALDLLIQFAPHQVAQLCYEQVMGGFLNAVSLDIAIIRQEDRIIGGQTIPVIVESELLEASLVIVGSNPGALQLDRMLRSATSARSPNMSMSKEDLMKACGMPSDATRTSMRARVSELRDAVDEHFPKEGEGESDEPPKKEEPKEDKSAAAEDAPPKKEEERAVRSADDEDKDVADMDEDEAKRALRATRHALRTATVNRPLVAAAEKQIRDDVKQWIEEGRAPADKEEAIVAEHRLGRARRTYAAIPAGTYTTARSLRSVGTATDIETKQPPLRKDPVADTTITADANRILDARRNAVAGSKN